MRITCKLSIKMIRISQSREKRIRNVNLPSPAENIKSMKYTNLVPSALYAIVVEECPGAL
jgi:hypothetical protein